MFKLLRRMARGNETTLPIKELWSGRLLWHGRAQFAVIAIYAVLLGSAVGGFTRWEEWALKSGFSPIWPLLWVPDGQQKNTAILLFLAHLTVLGLVSFFPFSRVLRILTFLTVFLVIAYKASFGKISHVEHIAVYVTAILIFLPTHTFSLHPLREVTVRVRQLLWAALATLMATYSFAGVMKLIDGVQQAARSEVSIFHPDSFSYHIASRLDHIGVMRPFGIFLVDLGALCWPLLLFNTYLTSCAFIVMFRPTLIRWWAAALLGFHLVTCVTMGTVFPLSSVLLVILAWSLPQGYAPTSLRGWLRLLPGLGLVDNLFVKRFKVLQQGKLV